MQMNTGMTELSESPKVWFIGDAHFHHTRIIQYCNRPFKDVLEMNETIIKNWNSMVEHEDHVFYLGDFGLGNYEKLTSILKRLHGKIYFIKGNHDKTSYLKKWESEGLIIGFGNKLSYGPYTMVHDPKDMKGEHLICGHIHEKWKKRGNNINVGVDVWNFGPVQYSEVLHEMLNQV